MPHTTYIATAVAIGITIGAVYKLREELGHASRAAALGCKRPQRAFDRDSSGVLSFIDGFRASQEKKTLEWFTGEFDRLTEEKGSPVSTVIIRTPFFQDVLFTCEPKNIQSILALDFKTFELGIGRTDNFYCLLGSGIFSSNGKQWEESRAILRPQFARSQISDLALEEVHVQALMRVLESHVGSDSWTDQINLLPLLFRLTLDSATEFLFGESVNSQSTSQSLSQTDELTFERAFDETQMIMAFGFRLNSHYWMIRTPSFYKKVKKVHQFIDMFVEKALKRASADKDGLLDDEEGQPFVFLNALVKETTDPMQLRTHLSNVLLAGRDTTASTLGWFFFTMAQEEHVEIFNRLRALILEEFGTYSEPRDITFERLKGCQYLQWCINEILRLYPIVVFNNRTAVKDTVLPVGGGPDGKSPVYVRKGTDIGWSVHVMHRRKDLWGEDADQFRPERWEGRRYGWDYLPFSGGPRICLGQQFALAEIGYVVVRLMQRIDSIDGSKVGPVLDGLTLTNSPGNGVNVRLHFADS